MRTDVRVCLVVAVLLGFGCGDDSIEPGATGGGTGDESEGEGPGADESTSGDQADSDTGAPAECSARRHTLLDEEPCGQVAIADLDADGVDDVLVVAGFNTFIAPAVTDKRMYSYEGTDPLLGSPEVHCCLRSGDALFATALDVNGDGREDPLVAVQQALISGDVGTVVDDLEMWLRGPQGGYVDQPRVARDNGLGFGPRPAVGQFVPDAPGIVMGLGENMLLYESDGLGLVYQGVALELAENAIEVGVVDLDGDGLDDAVVRTSTSIARVHNDGDGSFALMSQAELPLSGLMHLADLDGDGVLEVLLVGSEGLAVGQLDGDDASWAVQGLAMTGPVALADVDTDGVVDLVSTDATTVVAYSGIGDGTFSDDASILSTAAGEKVVDLDVGDVDGDGRDAVVVCDEQGVLVIDP